MCDRCIMIMVEPLLWTSGVQIRQKKDPGGPLPLKFQGSSLTFKGPTLDPWLWNSMGPHKFSLFLWFWAYPDEVVKMDKTNFLHDF